jgi:hypothetical protein
MSSPVLSWWQRSCQSTSSRKSMHGTHPRSSGVEYNFQIIMIMLQYTEYWFRLLSAEPRTFHCLDLGQVYRVAQSFFSWSWWSASYNHFLIFLAMRMCCNFPSMSWSIYWRVDDLANNGCAYFIDKHLDSQHQSCCVFVHLQVSMVWPMRLLAPVRIVGYQSNVIVDMQSLLWSHRSGSTYHLTHLSFDILECTKLQVPSNFTCLIC